LADGATGCISPEDDCRGSPSARSWPSGPCTTTVASEASTGSVNVSCTVPGVSPRVTSAAGMALSSSVCAYAGDESPGATNSTASNEAVAYLISAPLVMGQACDVDVTSV
jgi:hypothetical protein